MRSFDRPAGNAPSRAEELDQAVARRVLEVLPSASPLAELDAYYRLLREYPRRGGKRIRARLTLLSTAAHGAPWRNGLSAAAAIELFQNWVLIHDDVEDDSDERRGRPTLHRQVGVPLAINAGDGLHAYMWQLLLDDARLPPEVLREFLWLVHRTAEGQHLDLSWVARGRFDIGEEEYLEMVRLKTACYTVVSPLRLGALSAGRQPQPLLTRAAENLGIAFQIRDDVINLTPGAPSGKEFAGDLLEGKRTLILAHFFAQASPPEREEAVARLSGRRAERTENDVEALLSLLHRHGSIAHAQQVAESYAARGLELLDAALPHEETPGRGELLALLRSLVERNK